MIRFLGRLTTYDWVSVVSYATAFLTIFVGPDTLQAWGLSHDAALTWSTKIASAIAVLTLISNRLKNPSPSKGTSPLLVTSATPMVLATAKVAIDPTDPPKVVPL